MQKMLTSGKKREHLRRKEKNWLNRGKKDYQMSLRYGRRLRKRQADVVIIGGGITLPPPRNRKLHFLFFAFRRVYVPVQLGGVEYLCLSRRPGSTVRQNRSSSTLSLLSPIWITITDFSLIRIIDAVYTDHDSADHCLPVRDISRKSGPAAFSTTRLNNAFCNLHIFIPNVSCIPTGSGGLAWIFR